MSELKKYVETSVFRQNLLKVLQWIVKLVANLEVEGAENLPESGAYLVTTNHISLLDPPFLMLATKRKDITAMVASKYEKTPLISWFLKKVGVIWINREGSDFQAFRQATDFLKSGGSLGIAPEGTRSKTGNLIEGKPGSVLLALKANVQIIPATVLGPADLKKNILRLRKTNVKVIFGKAYSLVQPKEGESPKDVLDQNLTEIMCQIAALLPEERRGFYRDNPRLKVILAKQNAASSAEMELS
ncbi:MAG: 1-acyl-sn-glycerol-3-phosphate acyltransferase [Anaerolineaceae bacterium]|nr:1-acyl-sn-glycerol-3-phosphate acyltransferase [Anaerolineaceae bacterium]